MEAEVIEWHPQAGQQEFSLRIPSNVYEILYGGSRGGGKTEAGIMWLIKPNALMGDQSMILHPRYRALVLRRNFNDLLDWIDRADRIYRALGGALVKTPQYCWTFPSGAKIYANHLRDAESYTKYQGAEFQRMLIEELTQIKSELLYTKLLGSCRSSVPELQPQIFMTTNPGGVGHSWVRGRFVSAAPPNRFFRNPKTGRVAIFVPASIDDNPALKEADPGYVQWLEALKETDERLYKAWRFGSWDVFEGAVFNEFDYYTHTFADYWFDLRYCERIAALDWGYRDPTSIHWLARLPENEYGVQHIAIYREIYRNQVSAEQWGKLLLKISNPKTGLDPVRYIVMPHDTFGKKPDAMTISQTIFHESGIPIKPAESLVKGARLNRISLMHQLLAPAPDGFPYLLIHQTCKNLIRTLPELVYDETLTEYIDEDAEDHAFDSATYGLMTMKPKFVNEPALVQMRSTNALPVSSFADRSVQHDVMAAVAGQNRYYGSPE